MALAFAATLFFIVGCNSGSESGAPFNYSGSWSGTISDSLAGTGTISASMIQKGSDIGGTWSAAFDHPEAGNTGGVLLGEIEGNSVGLLLEPSNPELCPYAVVVTRSGATLQGDYSAINCTIVITGTVSISKN